MELYEINKSLQDFRKRLDELVKAINLPKLEEELLDYFGNGKEYSEEMAPACLSWWRSALVHLM